MRCLFLLAPALLSVQLSTRAAESNFNYAEALQKSLYFYEAQQSGRLSPNNRVPWRTDACLTDGQDIGRDLSGGWYDAGDHWTANLTMAFASMTLAWGAVENPGGFTKSGQMDELIEGLIHVNGYFLKCLLNPDAKDAADYDIVIGCGGREGVEPPAVHGMWAAAELASLMTNRPTFRVNKQVPASDIPGAMAAAMAASSMVIREHGAVLKGKRGYDEFHPTAFADELLSVAEKFFAFAQPHIAVATGKALRSDGQVVETGYRAGGIDKVFVAASWLARAYAGRDAARSQQWFRTAEAIYDGPYVKASLNDWWRDYSAGGIGKLGAYNMMRLAPDVEKYHFELQYYCSRFCDYKATPGGLRLREWHAHEYGSLRHANNAATIALHYSRHVEQAPKLTGNTYWKGSRTNAELKEQYFAVAKSQVDYALGANPYGRSYLVGFGKQPFNNVHHRGAHGPWAGFNHFIKDKPEYRHENRHVLYGALVAGPDSSDVFLTGKEQRPWLTAKNEEGREENIPHYKFPNREQPIPRWSYQFDSADPIVQDVMDSQFNEVALDYNAGITASFALLTASGLSAGEALPDTEFPPKVQRDDSTDLLTTDREFFASAMEIASSSSGTEIEVTVDNRSRWPAQITEQLSFRYFFTLPAGADLAAIKAEVGGDDSAKLLGVKAWKGQIAYVEVAWPGVKIYPGAYDKHSRRTGLKITAPVWNPAGNGSHKGIGKERKLLPQIPVYNAGKHLGGDEPAA